MQPPCSYQAHSIQMQQHLQPTRQVITTMDPFHLRAQGVPTRLRLADGVEAGILVCLVFLHLPQFELLNSIVYIYIYICSQYFCTYILNMLYIYSTYMVYIIVVYVYIYIYRCICTQYLYMSHILYLHICPELLRIMAQLGTSQAAVTQLLLRQLRTWMVPPGCQWRIH